MEPGCLPQGQDNRDDVDFLHIRRYSSRRRMGHPRHPGNPAGRPHPRKHAMHLGRSHPGFRATWASERIRKLAAPQVKITRSGGAPAPMAAACPHPGRGISPMRPGVHHVRRGAPPVQAVTHRNGEHARDRARHPPTAGPSPGGGVRARDGVHRAERAGDGRVRAPAEHASPPPAVLVWRSPDAVCGGGLHPRTPAPGAIGAGPRARDRAAGPANRGIVTLTT